jgi:hypothetical protein
MIAPPPLLLYSTNTYLKFRLQDRYRGEHHVWCSPAFSAEKLGKYSLGSNTPASSDPASIYRELLDAAIRRPDGHNAKILSQKATILALAVDWCNANYITASERDDITAVVGMVPIDHWRPLLFVIPYAGVAGRVQEVLASQRASMEPEFIIPDLKPSEFGIVELHP